MDDATRHEEDQEREVTEQSRSFEVARTDDGWGVWRRDEMEPLAMYPPSDRGFEAAYEHFTRLNRTERMRALRARSMSVSLWIALVAGLLWILSTAIFEVRFNLIEDPFRSEEAFAAVQWMNVASAVSYPLFLVSFGAFVMLSLRRRGYTDRQGDSESRSDHDLRPSDRSSRPQAPLLKYRPCGPACL